MTTVCEKCGSDEILRMYEVWINPNTSDSDWIEQIETYANDQYHCQECGTECNVEDKENDNAE